ncbi:SDR family oxidoreductase [Bartonella sp. M0280]|uniref:SDR family NAD(P)-dependent oxidoreductase n=1 Tax=Bartonella apihabitans TaxID=2750929 RepID=UPI0018DC8AA0|nr:SDR family NAD(P)-dependent oxidoreductase [Bartonella apihabitans]MBI0168524.1 SDR family oxidoreductase [Bartonella apihabitans]
MTLHSPSFRLDDYRALITGAGRGLGLAIAEAFAASGAKVILCARSQNELEVAAQRIKDAGYCADILISDVSDVESFARKVQKLDGIDILVNNAGTNRPKPLNQITFDDYDSVMNINVRALYFATQAVTNQMIKDNRKGSIINISSQMGHVGAKNRTVYCASKWAVEGFTKAAAVELAPYGIRVNTICPTFIETPMTEHFFKNIQFRQEVMDKIPLGRLGVVDDIVGAAVFLASNASSLMTGSSLVVDGGWTAQ